MMELVPSEPDGFRRNNFDAIRLCLALFVVYSHSFAVVRWRGLRELTVRWLPHGVGLGTIAVATFFSISGLLVTHSWLTRPKLVNFVRKRFLRIAPGFWVCVWVCALVVAPLTASSSSAVTVRQRLRHALWASVIVTADVAPDAFPKNPLPYNLDGSLWTIHYEVVCYLLVALAGVSGVLRRRWWMLLVFLGLWALYAANNSLGMRLAWRRRYDVYVGTPGSIVFTASYFLAGVTFYLFRRWIPRSSWLAGLAIVVALGSSFARCGPVVVMPVAGTYLVLFVAYTRRFRLYGLGRFGDFSYGTYLYAFPIQQFLVLWRPAIGPTTLFLIAAPLSVLAGVVSWYAVERRFLDRSRVARGDEETAGAAGGREAEVATASTSAGGEV